MTDAPIPPSDPVRPWPSGVPQGVGSVTSALGAYYFLNRFSSLSPRSRALSALVAGGVSGSHMILNTMLENSVGFNRLMWGMSEYKKTGSWPSIDMAYAQTSEKLEIFAATERAKISSSEQAAIESSVEKVISTTNTGSNLATTSGSSSVTPSGSSGLSNSFLPSSDSSSIIDLLTQLYENLFKKFIEFFSISPVEGHFDDLVGQRMFIEFILFTSCIFVFILFILFILNLIFVLNKDRILNKFKSKYVKWVLEYEFFLSKITLVVFPLLILLGLYTIGSGLVWSLTHPIPYESLNVDLHQFVSSNKSLVCLSLSLTQDNKKNLTIKKKFLNPRLTKDKFGFRQTCRYFNSSVNSSNKDIEVHKVKASSDLNVIYGGNSPLFNNLVNILNQSPINRETQLKIETFLFNQGLSLTNLQNKNQVSSKLTQFFLDKKPKLENLINNYKQRINSDDPLLSDLKNKIIVDIPTDFLISIILGRLLQIISNNNIINNKTGTLEVTLSLGKELTFKYLYLSYQKDKRNNNKFYFWKKENHLLVSTLEVTQFRFELGQILLNILVDLNLVKNIVKVLGRDEKKSILVVDGELLKVLPKLTSSNVILSFPKKLPMVTVPNSYKLGDGDYLEFGGYLLNGVEYTDKIILSNWELSSETKLLGKNDICNMVNKISSVPFKINGEVLDFILLNNEKYNFYCDINVIHPLSLKEKLSGKQEKDLQAFNSKRNLELNILGIATIFRDVPSLYIPVRLDYRGRLYCVAEYLNYQSTDLAKGLLCFSKGESVSLSDKKAISYLKIFGANCFGHKLDKLSFNKRVEWVENNLNDIYNFENGLLLSKAENKILFISFCFEFKKYIDALNKGENEFISNLPIQLDASCNGFQHLTLLIDDIALSKELNLGESNWSDHPKDFYSFVSLKVKNYFKEKLDAFSKGKLELNAEDYESYLRLSKLSIHRVLIKKAVMTIPYNASAKSIVEYLKESFEKVWVPEVNLDSKESSQKGYSLYKWQGTESLTLKEVDFSNLRVALNYVIFVDYPKLSELLTYLKDIARVSNKLKIPIIWKLPTGLIINQQFYEKKTLKLKPFAYSKSTLSLGILNKNKFNENKQKIALMPNLVHSLDAASLCLLITTYFNNINNINFYSIHDCFAVTCNKVEILAELLKSVYCIIYSNRKYLQDFDANFRADIISTYGEASVCFNDKSEKVTIITNNDKLTIKYPAVSKIIDKTPSQIDVSKSTYLTH